MIELLVVMIIAAVMAATAVPMMSSMDTNRGMIAARHLQRGLDFARQRAMATGTKCWVVFDTTAETWTVKTEDPSSPGRAGATVLTDPATGQNFVQTLNVNEAVGIGITTAAFDSNDEVAFDWLGRPFNESETALAAQGVVTLTGGHQVTVEIRTGYVRYTPP